VRFLTAAGFFAAKARKNVAFLIDSENLTISYDSLKAFLKSSFDKDLRNFFGSFRSASFLT